MKVKADDDNLYDIDNSWITLTSPAVTGSVSGSGSKTFTVSKADTDGTVTWKFTIPAGSSVTYSSLDFVCRNGKKYVYREASLNVSAGVPVPYRYSSSSLKSGSYKVTFTGKTSSGVTVNKTVMLEITE